MKDTVEVVAGMLLGGLVIAKVTDEAARSGSAMLAVLGGTVATMLVVGAIGLVVWRMLSR